MVMDMIVGNESEKKSSIGLGIDLLPRYTNTPGAHVRNVGSLGRHFVSRSHCILSAVGFFFCFTVFFRSLFSLLIYHHFVPFSLSSVTRRVEPACFHQDLGVSVSFWYRRDALVSCPAPLCSTRSGSLYFLDACQG